MPQERIELIRSAAEVFDSGDLERWLSEFFDPEIEWRTAAEDPDAATHCGRKAFKRYVQQRMEAFEGLRADNEEYVDAEDGRVFTWVHWTGRGRASGVEADWYLAIIYTLRDGKVVRGEEYFDRAEALEAAGLREGCVREGGISISSSRRSFRTTNACLGSAPPLLTRRSVSAGCDRQNWCRLRRHGASC